ncbi:unnamed protein product, partial [Ixodes hexagonus]
DYANSRVNAILAMIDMEHLRAAANSLRAATNALMAVDSLEAKLSPAALLIILPILLHPEVERHGQGTVASIDNIVSSKTVQHVCWGLDSDTTRYPCRCTRRSTTISSQWSDFNIQSTGQLGPETNDFTGARLPVLKDSNLANFSDSSTTGTPQLSLNTKYFSDVGLERCIGSIDLQFSHCAMQTFLGVAVASAINKSTSSDESSYAQLPQSAPSQDVLESLVENALQSGTLQPGSSSKLLFGELLDLCKHEAPVTFQVMLSELGIDGCVKLRESGHSEVFRIRGIRGTAVLKVVHIEYIVRHLQHLISEVRVSLFLRDLRENLDNRTTGFSELRDTYCIWDKYPSVLDNACTVYHSRKNFSLFGEDIRNLYRPYFVMYMSFAGQPLPKAQFENSLQVRSVIEQVAMTLAVGETAFQFEHRGLTTEHILIKPSNDQRAQYCIMRNSVFIDIHGVEASIVDFSMSRICLTPGNSYLHMLFFFSDAQPLYSDLHNVADDKKCTAGESFMKIYDLVRDDLSKYRPWTNVIFLNDVVNQLRVMYQDCFRHTASEAESQAWRDVCLWGEELLSFSSVTSFVLARVVPKAHSSSGKSLMDFGTCM